MKGAYLKVWQQKALLELYLSDRAEAMRLAEKFGVQRSYPAELARRAGLKSNARLPGNDRFDPRWEWAKQRGAVVI